MIVDLPEEVLVHIFEYLDYKSLQCIAVQVCKEWLSIIRNDCKLSGELKIKQFKHEDLPNIKGGLISESFSPYHQNWGYVYLPWLDLSSNSSVAQSYIHQVL